MTTIRRSRLLVESRLQGALVVRVVFYWFFTVLAVALFRYCFRLIGGPHLESSSHIAELWKELGPSVLAATILLPLVVIDVLRWSNRFAGPAYRLNKALQELAQGQHVPPIRLRDGDFWQEAAEAVNTIAAEHQRLAANP